MVDMPAQISQASMPESWEDWETGREETGRKEGRETEGQEEGESVKNMRKEGRGRRGRVLSVTMNCLPTYITPAYLLPDSVWTEKKAEERRKVSYEGRKEGRHLKKRGLCNYCAPPMYVSYTNS